MTAAWHTADDHDLPPTNQTIRTVSGQYVNLLDPDPKTIVLEDIAHALSFINRYNGHTAQPYSVAEHSLGVAGMLMRSTGNYRTALFGLIHDAAEAYLGDMVRPLKRHDATYREAEERMEDVIWGTLIGDLHEGDDDRWSLVKDADTEILAFEMSTIRNAYWRIAPPPNEVQAAFLSYYHCFSNGVRP